MSAGLTSARTGDLQLTAQERQLISVFRSMSDDAKTALIAMAGGVARGSPATPVRLALVHSTPGLAQA